MLGDVGQPDLVGAGCAEEAFYKVAMARRANGSTLARLMTQVLQENRFGQSSARKSVRVHPVPTKRVRSLALFAAKARQQVLYC